MTIVLYILLTVHVAVSGLMILTVLMQRPRSEGLGAAFGGGMTDNVFGAQTTHVLAKLTTVLGITFFILTLAIAMIYSRGGTGETQIQRELLQMAPPAAAAETESSAPAAGSVVVDEVIVEPDAVLAPATQAETMAPAPEAAIPETSVPEAIVPEAPVEAVPAP